MQPVDGVHVLELTVERDGREIAFHPAAIETPRGLLLLDTGLPGTAAGLEARLEAAGFEFGDVAGIVVTHQDGDHAGSLAEVRERADAFVAAHHRATPYVEGDATPVKSDGDRYRPTQVDIQLVEDVAFRTAAGVMEVIETPGHTPGHVSLYFPDERLLVAADALTADQDGLAGPSEQHTLDMDQAAQSLGRLAELDVERTLCFHGGFVEAGTEEIRAIRDALR